MPAEREALTKLRILVAEDEILVAMLVEEMLQELGCEIVATVSSVAEATAAVRRNNLDAALLDGNLNGENSSPVADELPATRCRSSWSLATTAAPKTRHR